MALAILDIEKVIASGEALQCEDARNLMAHYCNQRDESRELRAELLEARKQLRVMAQMLDASLPVIQGYWSEHAGCK